MNRRDILRYTAFATGAAMSTPLLTSLLSGCSTEVSDAPGSELSFFDKNDFKLVRSMVDVILPKTDSPSASEVGVHLVIDNMVGQVYTIEEQAEYRKGFDALALHLDNFNDLDEEEKLQVLLAIPSTGSEDAKKAFLDFKQQSIAYYLSTEEIGKNYLNYLPVPGDWEACIPVDTYGGKAWAL